MPQPDPTTPVAQKVADALDASPRIVNDWRRIPRFLSAKALAIIFAAQSVWTMMDADMRASLPPHFIQYFTIVFAVLGFFGLFWKQNSGSGRDDLGRKCNGAP